MEQEFSSDINWCALKYD